MTEQSNNDQFHASSFLQGQNADFVEHLYARYSEDPESVDPNWQAFFQGLGDALPAGAVRFYQREGATIQKQKIALRFDAASLDKLAAGGDG